MKQLITALSTQARLLGADLIGVTATISILDHQNGLSSELIEQYEKAISIGFVLPKSLMQTIVSHSELPNLYPHYLATVVIPTLDRVALLIANMLEKADYMGLALPTDLSALDGAHPYYLHNLIGSYAGLGWLGKHNRLVNPKFGSRVMVTTILTNAELEETEPVANACGQCTICTDNCPEKALSGLPFHPLHDPDDRHDSKLCRGTTCQICLALCPYNQ